MTIIMKIMESPIGSLYIGATQEGLHFLTYGKSSAEQYAKKWRYQLEEGENRIIKMAERQLSEYFAGERKVFDLPLRLKGTEFQQKVWELLMKISYGETVCYKDESEMLGNVDAIRAVSNANSKNPIAIVVPCHRVIGKKGKMVGYAGEIWRKEYLLNLEQGLNSGDRQLSVDEAKIKDYSREVKSDDIVEISVVDRDIAFVTPELI